MVAKAGRGWVLAPSLVTLIDQVDDLFPGRDRASDGSIGDPAHQTRKSGHNPGRGSYVHALDITHDPANGFDSYAFADLVRQRQDPRIKFVISHGRWFKSYGPTPWQWRAYDGPSGHFQHVHIEVNEDHEGEHDGSSWFGGQSFTQPSGGGAEVQLEVLRQGSQGGQVRALQSLLNGIAGQGLDVDGDFGPRTDRAVRNVQTVFGLDVDGIVGTHTWGALFS